MMISKAQNEEMEERSRSIKKLELAKERSIEDEARYIRLKQKQMLIADRTREKEQRKVCYNHVQSYDTKCLVKQSPHVTPNI